MNKHEIINNHLSGENSCSRLIIYIFRFRNVLGKLHATLTRDIYNANDIKLAQQLVILYTKQFCKMNSYLFLLYKNKSIVYEI